MISGELILVDGMLELNSGVEVIIFMVVNIGDCLVQVGSYYYFVEINSGLEFDCEVVFGMCLDIVVGIVVCFESGQKCEVNLILILGGCVVYGFNQKVMGKL